MKSLVPVLYVSLPICISLSIWGVFKMFREKRPDTLKNLVIGVIIMLILNFVLFQYLL
jgi:hypothetical protein